ncbi:hypothetical protein BCD49_30035 [Pseudofrankia sp. EUN1h]|nr:hypothetical protein BCD49_30035 [Pseudofrankia sp. EUN1h]
MSPVGFICLTGGPSTSMLWTGRRMPLSSDYSDPSDGCLTSRVRSHRVGGRYGGRVDAAPVKGPP